MSRRTRTGGAPSIVNGMRRAIAAIRAIDPGRPIVLDGINGGSECSPELADTGCMQTVRGYQPFGLTHYGAQWEPSFRNFPPPTWPLIEPGGRVFDAARLVEVYAPWRAMEATGVPVQASEFGCYSKTPNDVALAWFKDLLALFRSYGWGWAMWDFKGDFGVASHGRPGARYEKIRGFDVDRDLLELIRP